MISTDIFKFRFYSEEDLDWVIKGALWMMVDCNPLMLRRWEDGMRLDMRSFEKVPVWVKLPRLHQLFRSHKMIGMIGCMIGDPICLDRVSTRRLNSKHELEFVRLLVEVSLEETKRTEVVLFHESGEKFVIPVEFE